MLRDLQEAIHREKREWMGMLRQQQDAVRPRPPEDDGDGSPAREEEEDMEADVAENPDGDEIIANEAEEEVPAEQPLAELMEEQCFVAFRQYLRARNPEDEVLQEVSLSLLVSPQDYLSEHDNTMVSRRTRVHT